MGRILSLFSKPKIKHKANSKIQILKFKYLRECIDFSEQNVIKLCFRILFLQLNIWEYGFYVHWQVRVLINRIHTFLSSWEIELHGAITKFLALLYSLCFLEEIIFFFFSHPKQWKFANLYIFITSITITSLVCFKRQKQVSINQIYSLISIIWNI